MIHEKVDSRGVRRLVVRKVENPETKKNSGYATDFSWELWNTAAEQYMQSIKALGNQRILEILIESFDLSNSPCRRTPFLPHSETLNSARVSLHSDDEDLETSGHHVVGDGEYQADVNACDSDTNLRARVGTAINNTDNLDRRPHAKATARPVRAQESKAKRVISEDDFFDRRLRVRATQAQAQAQASEASDGATDNSDAKEADQRRHPHKKSGHQARQLEE